MTRIGPSDRLSELLRIVGTRKVENKGTKPPVAGSSSSSAAEKSQETLRADLARELSEIDLSQASGQETARKMLIHRVILTRFEKMSLSASQLSFLTREVGDKAASRPEVRDLLDDVIRELRGDAAVEG